MSDEGIVDSERDSAITPKATRREWIGLAVIALPCLLYSMDLSVLNLAVPQLTQDLRPSAAQLLWIVDIYGFLLAGFLIPMGTLGDRIGRRRLLMIGAAAFGFASVLAAFANSAEMLIFCRALLGVAAATLAPSTLSLIRNMFLDAHERTLAIGLWVASFSAGGAIGPLIGGAMLEHFWWGSVFLLAVPMMVLVLTLGPLLLPEFRDPNAGRLDFFSGALATSAVLAVIYGMKKVAEQGANWRFGIVVLVGLGIGYVFIRRQRRLEDPMIDLRLFDSPVVSAALAINVLVLSAGFGFFLLIAQYLQLVLEMGPLEAGLWTAPSGITFVLGSMVTPFLMRRFGAANVLTYGFAVGAVGFGLLAQVDGRADFWLLMSGFILFCLGISPIGTITTDLVVSTAPPERAGVASGISETSFELGGALGIAVLGSIVTALYRGRMAEQASTGMPVDAVEAARDTLGGAVSVAEQLTGEVGVALLFAAREAFTVSMQVAAWISVALVLSAALLSAAVISRAPRRAPVENGKSPLVSDG